MMTISNRILLTVLLAVLWTAAHAQTDTIAADCDITNVQMVAIGSSNVLDTYLSPEKYTGADIRFISHTTRRPDGSSRLRYLIHEADFSMNEDRSGDGTMLTALYNFRYAEHWKWSLADDRLLLEAGGMLHVGIGVNDCPRNQNNPAQMRLFLHIGPSVAATWHTNIWRKAVDLRYEAMAPLAGVMFSPNYGQSYYEIFSRGNYDHNIVPTTIVSTPSLRHTLTADFTLWGMRLRVGYLGDIQQAAVNHLKQHAYTHAFVIGFVKHFRITQLHP